MSRKCGIVGLLAIGKSTRFDALAKSGIAVENCSFFGFFKPPFQV